MHTKMDDTDETMDNDDDFDRRGSTVSTIRSPSDAEIKLEGLQYMDDGYQSPLSSSVSSHGYVSSPVSFSTFITCDVCLLLQLRAKLPISTVNASGPRPQSSYPGDNHVPQFRSAQIMFANWYSRVAAGYKGKSHCLKRAMSTLTMPMTSNFFPGSASPSHLLVISASGPMETVHPLQR